MIPGTGDAGEADTAYRASYDDGCVEIGLMGMLDPTQDKVRIQNFFLGR